MRNADANMVDSEFDWVGARIDECRLAADVCLPRILNRPTLKYTGRVKAGLYVILDIECVKACTCKRNLGWWADPP